MKQLVRLGALAVAGGCGIATPAQDSTDGNTDGISVLEGTGHGVSGTTAGDGDGDAGSGGGISGNTLGSAGNGIEGDGGQTGTPTTTTSGPTSGSGSLEPTAGGSSADDSNDSNDNGGSEDGGCGSGSDEIEFSYIWISNSTQGTVSKIDTQTATEVGRYLVDNYEGQTLSNCQGPSRTSVNLAGDVAVLNRSGGLAKFYADPQRCPDLNGNGMVDTASDANYLPWLADECLAWKIDVPHPGSGCDGPRAVQWTSPPVAEDCTSAEPEVWIAFCDPDNGDAIVWLIDGADGSITTQYVVPGYGCNTYGPYGGAVDSDNNFWFVDRSSGQSLYRVAYGCDPSGASECWREIAQPSGEDAYGITIDATGRLWMAGGSNSLYAYDPATDTWQSYQSDLDDYFTNSAPADSNESNILRGLMADADGTLWIASINAGAWGGGSNPGMLRVDPSMSPPDIEFYGPTTFSNVIEHAAGISIDVEGYVWLVDTLGDQAFKVNPADPTDFVRVEGLQYPYTYSDMTGFALQQVSVIPQ